MRRSDREITDREELLRVIGQCDVCRLAFNTGSFPYILPLNFGWTDTDGVLTLYFHGAAEGLKYAIMAKCPYVSFEMDCRHVLDGDLDRGRCTMHYESVIGRGLVEEIEEEEQKAAALDLLCKQYYPDGFPYNPAAISRTRVWKLTVSAMTGKRR